MSQLTIVTAITTSRRHWTAVYSADRVRVRVIGHSYSALLWDEPIARVLREIRIKCLLVIKHLETQQPEDNSTPHDRRT